MSEFFDTEKYRQWILAAEQDANNNFHHYKIKLKAYATLGYLVLFSVLLLLLGLVLGLIFLASYNTIVFILLLKNKIIFFIIPLIWILFRSLWIKFEEPEGMEITREDFPQLFNDLDEMQKQLQTPTIHKVLVIPDLNAAFFQSPRLGVLGWQKNILILGLQLLLILSHEQAKSVLAHELGHLSSNHNRFNGWIYRLRMVWEQVMLAFQHSHSFGARLLARFFNWYSPKFAAYSFVLARRNEYEADGIAAKITTGEIAANALIRTYTATPYLDKIYWQTYYQQAYQLKKPPYGPYQGMVYFIEEFKKNSKELSRLLKKELKRETGIHDTHPALKDRIKGMGQEQLILSAYNIRSDKKTYRDNFFPQESAAKFWFQEHYTHVLKLFDDSWLEANQEEWLSRYEKAKEIRVELLELEKQDIDQLNQEQLWQLAIWTEELKTAKKAYPLYQEFQKQYPDDPAVAHRLGRFYYEKGDAACLIQFEKAIKAQELIIESSEYAYDFLISKGQMDEATKWMERAEKQVQINFKAEQERIWVTEKDQFQQAEIEQESKQLLISKLQSIDKLNKVWLAEKKVKYYPEIPCYILVVSYKGWSWNHKALITEIQQQLEFPSDLFILVNAGEYKPLAKKVIRSGLRF